MIKFDDEHKDFLNDLMSDTLKSIYQYCKSKSDVQLEQNITKIECAVNLSIGLLIQSLIECVKKEGLEEMTNDILNEIKFNFNKLLDSDFKALTMQ